MKELSQEAQAALQYIEQEEKSIIVKQAQDGAITLQVSGSWSAQAWNALMERLQPVANEREVSIELNGTTLFGEGTHTIIARAKKKTAWNKAHGKNRSKS